MGGLLTLTGEGMNEQVQSQEQIQEQIRPQLIQAQWIQYIMPIMTGIVSLVFISGMVRDLVKGKEVKLPSQK